MPGPTKLEMQNIESFPALLKKVHPGAELLSSLLEPSENRKQGHLNCAIGPICVLNLSCVV